MLKIVSSSSLGEQEWKIYWKLMDYCDFKCQLLMTQISPIMQKVFWKQKHDLLWSLSTTGFAYCHGDSLSGTLLLSYTELSQAHVLTSVSPGNVHHKALFCSWCIFSDVNQSVHDPSSQSRNLVLCSLRKRWAQSAVWTRTQHEYTLHNPLHQEVTFRYLEASH